MKIIPMRTVYLEMTQKPCYRNIVPPVRECFVMRACRPTVAFYRFLYGTVGKDWFWVNRLKMCYEELKKILEDEGVEIYVLYVNGTPAGYAEIDRRIDGEIEFVYFGLMPEFIGRGLGWYFLRLIVLKVWEYNPIRLWLHTCELDHPAALVSYLKAGFKIYDFKIIQQEIHE